MQAETYSLPLMAAAFVDAPILTGQEVWKMAAPVFDGEPVRVLWVSLGELWLPLSDMAKAIKVPLSTLRPRVPDAAVLYLSSKDTPHLRGTKRLLMGKRGDGTLGCCA